MNCFVLFCFLKEFCLEILGAREWRHGVHPASQEHFGSYFELGKKNLWPRAEI